MVLLGGRAAEEIIFGQDCVTTGACNDLQRSTQLITNMVTEYGMGDSLGLLSLKEISTLNISSGESILSECKTLVNSLYEETKKLIIANREDLNKIASELIEKETIYKKDLEKILL